MKKVCLIGLGRMAIVFGLVMFLGCQTNTEEKHAAQKQPQKSLGQPQDMGAAVLRTNPKEWEPSLPTRSQADLFAQTQKAPRRSGHRFSQRLKVLAPPQTIKVNQTVVLPVIVKNVGPEPWPTTNAPSGTRTVNLSYHWIIGNTEVAAPEARESTKLAQVERLRRRRPLPRTDILRKNGRVVVLEGIRTPLPREIAPGEEITLNATVQAPPQTGSFVLRFSMVREGEEWFENRGGKPLDLPVLVAAQ